MFRYIPSELLCWISTRERCSSGSAVRASRDSPSQSPGEGEREGGLTVGTLCPLTVGAAGHSPGQASLSLQTNTNNIISQTLQPSRSDQNHFIPALNLFIV